MLIISGEFCNCTFFIAPSFEIKTQEVLLWQDLHFPEIFITEMLMDICQKKGKTMVMVTHSKEIARKYGDVIIDLKEYSRG